MIDFDRFLDLWAAVLWRASWQGALVAAAAWAICLALRAAPANLQSWCWRLAAAKFLAVGLLWAVVVKLPLLPAEANFAAGGALRSTVVLPSIASITVVSPTPWPSMDLRVALFGLWSLGAIAGLARLAAAWLATRRLVRHCQPIDDFALTCLLRQQLPLFDLRNAPQLLRCPGRGSPMLVGLLSPAIVVPIETLQRLGPDERMMVLGHELAHVRRADLPWCLLARIVRVLFFFHPAAWWVERRLVAAQESAADELAIARQRHEPVAYAELLLSLVRKLDPRRVSPALSLGTAGTRHSLTRRLTVMSYFNRRSRGVVVTAGLLFAALLAVGLLPWQLAAAERRRCRTATAGQSAAATKASADEGKDYLAEIKFVQVSEKGARTDTINTQIAGNTGTPLKKNIGGHGQVRFELNVEEAKKAGPNIYMAEFKVFSGEPNTNRENVLSCPRIFNLYGQKATIMVGEEGGDRIEIECAVTLRQSAK